MKRLFLKVLSVFSFSLFMLTSCDDPIFSSIRDEVELEDAEVPGAIYSIVRYKDHIYVQNGKIYRKANSDVDSVAHEWDELPRPSEISSDYVYVNKLASDSDYLYAEITKISADESEGENLPTGKEIWCYHEDSKGENGEWNKVSFPVSSSDGTTDLKSSFKNADTVYLFSTLSSKESMRHAFVNVNGSGYKLNGKTAVLYKAADGCSVVAGFVADKMENSDNLFFGTCNSMISTDDNEFFYIANSEVVRYGTKAQIQAARKSSDKSTEDYFRLDYSKLDSINVGTTIYSLALTKDTLLVGTYSGLRMYELEKNIPDDHDFSSSFKNTSSTLSSYYRIHVVFSFDPSKVLKESAVYASADYSGSSSSTSASVKNRGLWAYISEIRNTWNRE